MIGDELQILFNPTNSPDCFPVIFLRMLDFEKVRGFLQIPKVQKMVSINTKNPRGPPHLKILFSINTKNPRGPHFVTIVGDSFK